MVTVLATIPMAMKEMHVRMKEASRSLIDLDVGILMAMVGQTPHKIGLLHLGVRQMHSLQIDFNGKILMRTGLEMLAWAQREMIAQM